MTKYNNAWFLSKVTEKRPNDKDEYQFLEPYVNAKTTLKTLHVPCGNIVDILPNTFLSRGSGCKHCNIKKRNDSFKKTHEQVTSEFPDTITAITRYTGVFDPMTVHCSSCNRTYDVCARELVKRGCTRCTKTFKRTLKDVMDEVDKDTHGEYVVTSSSYTNAHTHIEVRHLSCGTVYPVTMHNFRKGRRCPECNLSVGEELVKVALSNLEVNFSQQVEYPDLVHVRKLSYDFYLPNHNVLIEYQGEQHYHPVKHFGGADTFETQQVIDAKKREYAMANGITLLEIPYTNKTLEGITKLLQTELHL